MSMMMYLAPVLGVVGLVVAFVIYNSIKSKTAGNEKMKEISDMIHDGAMAFLGREYKVLSFFVAIVFVLMLFSPNLGINTAAAFLAGAICSVAAGFFGMKSATRANVRTSEAARTGGMASALSVSYNGGAVMGLSVASLGLEDKDQLEKFVELGTDAAEAFVKIGLKSAMNTYNNKSIFDDADTPEKS